MNNKIDPQNITNYEQSHAELETFLLFSVAVAGKTATHISHAISDFLEMEEGETPFAKIQNMANKEVLSDNIKRARLGKWRVLTDCFMQLAHSNIDLHTISCEQLEKFPGIGPKTSRFFIMHSRKDQQVAVLDTHVLRFLRDKGYNVPKTTPTGKKYLKIENIFIKEYNKLGYQDIAEFDLAIWNYYSKKSGNGKSLFDDEQENLRPCGRG